MFIVDQLIANSPTYGPGSTVIIGYNAAGQVAYHSSTTTATSPIRCYVAPNGDAVTPPVAAQSCATAIPWS